MSVAPPLVFLLSTAVVDEAKVVWLMQTVEAQSARLDDQARQIAALQEQLAESVQVGSRPATAGGMGDMGMREAPGRRLSLATERNMWHASVFHKFEVPDSTGCGLAAELHTATEPLMIMRETNGNLTMQYDSTGVSFSTPAPITLTHHAGCTTKTLALEATVTIPSMNAFAAGQVGTGSNAIHHPAISPSIIGASNLMGLSLRLAAMAVSFSLVTEHTDLKCMDIHQSNSGTPSGVTHMYACHGGLNQLWSIMGPYIVSHSDPDCINPNTINTNHPRCSLQPQRLLDGGTPLCLTWGDGTATPVTTAGTTCPNDAGNSNIQTGCKKIRLSVTPCTIGTTNLFQQWKVKDFTGGGHGLSPMAHTGDLCLDYSMSGSDLYTHDCHGGTNQKWLFRHKTS